MHNTNNNQLEYINCKVKQTLDYIKVIAVIKSCKTLIQLENSRNWFDKVALINNFPHFSAHYIAKAYRAKKQQIQNGLAAKYN